MQSITIALFAFLLIATLISVPLHLRSPSSPTLTNLQQRINSWWAILLIGIPIIFLGQSAITLFFILASTLTLREYLSALPPPITSLPPTTQTSPESAQTTPTLNRLPYFFSFLSIPLQYTLITLASPFLAISTIPILLILFALYSRYLTPANKTPPLASSPLNPTHPSPFAATLLCVYCLSFIPLLFWSPLNPTITATLILLFIISIQLSDVFQYITGKLFGRHHFAPTISPNKTTEGLIAGTLLSVLSTITLSHHIPLSTPLTLALFLPPLLLAPLSSLLMSYTKRTLHIKDWGHSLPGHGGFLDRFDSLILPAPLFWTLNYLLLF